MSTNYSKDCSPEEVYEFELADAISNLPSVPSLEVLKLLRTAAMASKIPGIHADGKALQNTHGLETIPPVTEYETAAGLWAIIRTAIIDAKSAQK